MSARMPRPLQVADWPLVDQAAWAKASHPDPLAPGGAGAGSGWRASTRTLVELRYGCWLSWLKASEGIDPEVSAWERATPDRVRAYLAEMEAVGFADYTRANTLQAVSDALRVMCPGAPIGFISKAAGRIFSNAVPKRDIASRLRPASDVLELGMSLMAEARNENLSELRRAIAFRDGLMIALWSHRPMRIGNSSQIQIGVNLVQLGEGWALRFKPQETKQKRHWDCSWPIRLESHLKEYLTRYRPVLIAKSKENSNALWISQFGRPMPPPSVAQIIKLRTKAAFGKHLSSHTMRYIAATSLAEVDPASRTDIAAILGHANTKPSEKHYILATGFAAASAYGDLISELQMPEREPPRRRERRGVRRQNSSGSRGSLL